MPQQLYERRPSSRDAADDRTDVSSEELFALFEADYTEEILVALGDRPMAARDLVRECAASRATVYRRLNALHDAGLVAETMTYDPDGHHRTVYRATVDRISIELTGDGLSMTAASTGADDREPARSPADD